MPKKKKKAKATAGNATKRGLASKSATAAIASPVAAGSNEEAVTVSDPMPQSSLTTEAEKVIAPSPDAQGTSQQPTAIRQVDVMLGQIVAVLMRSPLHKQRPLADLEWLVLPAVLSRQVSVVKAPQSGIPVPVGVAIWATVSTTVDQRLSDLSTPLRLQSGEWRSGEIPWLIELVADTGPQQQALLKHLGETVFKGRGIKMRIRGADGKTQIGTLKGIA
jgi:hemolysin-activating ACP:hemolysin acyltransferase